MNISELMEMMEKDLALDRSNLDIDSIETAKLQAKYFKLYANYIGEVKMLEHDLTTLRQEKYKYYRGQATAEVYKKNPLHEKISTNAQAQAHVDADEDVTTIQKKIDIINIKVELIKDIKNALNQRNWQIRNAIEFMRFQNGG